MDRSVFKLQICVDGSNICSPNWSIIDIKKYNENIHINKSRQALPVMASRGCPFKCDFCSTHLTCVVPHFIRITLNSNVDVYTAYNLILGVAGLIAPFIAMMVIKNDDEKIANMNGTLFLAGMLIFLSFALNYLFNIQSEALLYIVVGIMAIAVIIITVMNIATTITIKSKIPEDILGRIVSIIQLCAVVAMPLGQLLYGYFADNFPATISFIFSAFGLCITYLVMRKTYKRLDEGKNDRA